MRPRLASFAFTLGFVVATAGPALAQSPPPERLGLELGAGLQAGKIFCNGPFCGDKFMEAGGLDLNVSFFLRPNLGLYGELWGMAHTDGDVTFSHYINTLGVKWRPMPVITVQAGVGAAHASINYKLGSVTGTANTENAFAVMAAVSFDLVRSHTWAIAIEARGGTGFYGNKSDSSQNSTGRNVGLGATFTYFGF